MLTLVRAHGHSQLHTLTSARTLMCIHHEHAHTRTGHSHSQIYSYIPSCAHTCVHSHAYTCIRNTHMHMTHVHSCAHAHPVCHLSGRIEDAASHIWMPGHNIEEHRDQLDCRAKLRLLSPGSWAALCRSSPGNVYPKFRILLLQQWAMRTQTRGAGT